MADRWLTADVTAFVGIFSAFVSWTLDWSHSASSGNGAIDAGNLFLSPPKTSHFRQWSRKSGKKWPPTFRLELIVRWRMRLSDADLESRVSEHGLLLSVDWIAQAIAGRSRVQCWKLVARLVGRRRSFEQVDDVDLYRPSGPIVACSGTHQTLLAVQEKAAVTSLVSFLSHESWAGLFNMGKKA